MIACGFEVLTTVCFDDQPCSKMNKIYNIVTDNLLSAKFLAIQPVGAQVVPEYRFSFGHAFAQMLGEILFLHAP